MNTEIREVLQEYSVFFCKLHPPVALALALGYLIQGAAFLAVHECQVCPPTGTVAMWQWAERCIYVYMNHFFLYVQEKKVRTKKVRNPLLA